MTYSLSNNCTKNYYNRTLTVQVIVEDVVTWIFLRHSVHNDLESFQVLFIFSLFCAWIITTVEINSAFTYLKVKSGKCRFLPVVLVLILLLIWSWSYITGRRLAGLVYDLACIQCGRLCSV